MKLGDYLDIANSVWAIVLFLASFGCNIIVGIIRFNKVIDRLVSKDELKDELREYARKDVVEELKEDIDAGFDRITRLYFEDRKLQADATNNIMRRIDELKR